MINAYPLALLMVARDAQIAGLRATSLEAAAHQFKRIGEVLSILEQAADRAATADRAAAAEADEQQRIPPHWRQQPVALADLPPNVVPLRRRHFPIQHGGAA